MGRSQEWFVLNQGSLYAGIDAGGTATKCRLYRQGVGLIGYGVGPAGNVLTVGVLGVAQAIEEAVTGAADSAGIEEPLPIAGLAACVAGARSVALQDEVKKELEKRLYPANVDVFVDAAAGLFAGTLGRAGVVVIAGTGSAVWALDNDGTWHRAGGWGYLLGDEGSGFSMGVAALKAGVRAADGLGPPTGLVEAIQREWSLNDFQDVIPIVYADPLPKERIAALAPTVMDAAKTGDPVARQILRESVEDLVKLTQIGVNMVDLDHPVPVVTVGGVFSNDGVFSRFKAEVVRQGLPVDVRRPLLDPAAGACIVALRCANGWTPKEKDILVRSFSHRVDPVEDRCHNYQITTE